ncbi:MAG TPA: polyphosphate kinase 2 family protein [Pseudolabrys sp.]|nr:polyphosphate kinase 2 family protein [Pseudolabrys sp.]
MTLSDLAKRFRVDNPGKFRLSDCDPDECGGLDKQDAGTLLAEGLGRLSELQERLYASDRWSVLIVLQAMDAAGKDSLIKHVMTGLNPQGVEVHPFKQPSAEELDHNFLWRAARHLPERGRIGIFNRSHYEEVLVVRVHPELLERQKLPAPPGKDVWQQRFEDIRAFERHLARSGTRILKLFLHVSKEEQRSRFLERIEEPAKRWKFSMGDVAERKLWARYMDAYEDMIRNTSTPEAPWYVIPADRKWFTRTVVAGVLVHELDSLKLEFPKLDADALKELREAEKTLKAEKD